MTNARELLAEFERAEAYVGEFCAADEGYQQAVNDAVDALCALQEAAPDLARQVTQLEAQLAEIDTLPTNCELWFYRPMRGDDDDLSEEWRVHRWDGGINDREWTLIGRGATPTEAIRNALLTPSEEPK